MKELAAWALNRAETLGAAYADARVVDNRERVISTKNGKVGTANVGENAGIGIRAIADGAWGFASTDTLTREAVEHAASHAVAIARASARVKQYDVVLAPEKKYEADWASPIEIDPFQTTIEANIGLLLAIDREMRSVKGVTMAEAALHFRREESLFASTLGSVIRQVRYYTGGGYAAHAFSGNEIQKRSYPNSFGGQFQLRGYELIEQLALVENARRVGEEAVALHSADQCPEKTTDLILESAQLALQIHESIGHPIELDRVLGSEANFAGMSFLTIDQLNRLKYASEIVNVVADARLEHGPGLGTFAFDDEGVPAHSTDIVRDGMFRGYLTSRETASAVGDERSNGTMRAESWNRTPLIRMTNISLLPGDRQLDELIASTDDGIYMETNRSWSIDDKRYNFQFGCELGWEIKNGRRTRMLKNPSYGGITTEFWNSCDAICDRDHWVLWGTPNCGKGQPQQTMGTGHGAAPARFRGVKVGVAYSG